MKINTKFLVLPTGVVLTTVSIWIVRGHTNTRLWDDADYFHIGYVIGIVMIIRGSKVYIEHLRTKN